MKDKRFYWIKLKTDFFNQDTIDFLLSQKNGCEYIVLYQMLCLKTANTNGSLTTSIGEMIIPYDIEKIVRDTKYFDTDTVVVALELFKKLGLIYLENNNILKISNYEEMVGSECSSAKRVREWREKKVLQCNSDVTQEYRDESIEYRDVDNRDKKKENDNKINNVVLNEIIDYLNDKTGKHFKYTDTNKKHIKARLNEGFIVEDIKTVIDKKAKEWLNNDKMEKYLRPETLFGTKFESYLNEKEKELTTKDIANYIDWSDF